MKKDCPFESDVLKGLTGGGLTPELETHVKNCPSCGEATAVHDWMNRFQAVASDKAVVNKRLPDAETIWRKAQAVRSVPVVDKELEKKAMRPLRFMHRAAYWFTAFVAGYFILTHIPGIRRFLGVLRIGEESASFFTSLVSMLKTFFLLFSDMLPAMGVGAAAVILFAIIGGIESRDPHAGGPA